MVTHAQTDIHKPNPKYDNHALVLSSTNCTFELTSFSQANKHEEWRLAMTDEFNAFLHVGTWNLVPHTPTMNVLPNKWVFCVKRIFDGFIQRYKARLVANGFHQQPGLDYCFSRLVSVFLFSSSSVGIHSDSSLFIYIHGSVCIYLLIYVDDILVTGSDPTRITTLISDLGHQFSMKDLGPAHYFLGMELAHTSSSLSLTQTKYVVDLLKCANMREAKTVPTSAVSRLRLSLSDGDPLSNPTEYFSIVGALQYLTLTRPNIAFVVNHICQFIHQSTTIYWLDVKRILRYLNDTFTLGLLYSPSTLQLSAYADVDYAEDPNDSLSTGGYCVYLGTNLIYWSSKMQHGVSRSACLHCHHSVLITGFIS
ncbi:unnamed protein product [Prunus armeniaca]